MAFVSPTFLAALNSSTAFTRSIIQSDFANGDINMRVRSIDGCAILP